MKTTHILLSAIILFSSLIAFGGAEQETKNQLEAVQQMQTKWTEKVSRTQKEIEQLKMLRRASKRHEPKQPGTEHLQKQKTKYEKQLKEAGTILRVHALRAQQK